MLIEAITVFLALIGTTLSCINTGARVTYAMGKDQEVPEHFGMLHDKNLSPHRAIWALAVISASSAVIALLMVFGDSSAIADSAIAALPHGLWSSVWFATTHDHMAAFPNTLTMIVLASNFGTFLLYMLSCVICMVAYQGHPNFSALKHFLIPVFGVLANFACMAFYLIGPFMGYGTKMEPFGALSHRRRLGHLWRYLLHSVQQADRPDDVCREPRRSHQIGLMEDSIGKKAQ